MPAQLDDIDGPRHRRVELLAAVLLAMAAVATAWSTYQSTRWRGDQARQTARSTAAHIDSAEATGRAGQQTQVDIATFVQWVDASTAGDQQLADFYRQRFRDELRPAFDAWLATNPTTNPQAPHTPFEMPQYRLAESQRAADLAAAAVADSGRAAHALERADHYMLAVVLFATALFFAGMSSKFRSIGRRELLVGVGYAMFVVAASWVIVLAVADWT